MFYNLHTHTASGDSEIIELVNRYPSEPGPSGFYSIGIHPWHIDESKLEDQLSVIEAATWDSNCRAIGECGLDKRIETPLALQQEVFIRQVEIAMHHDKPLVLHCVAAYQEVIEIKNKLNVTVPMIIHGFSKNLQTANQLLDQGFHLSFGKYLLRNPELEHTFTDVPDDRFFLETDTIEENLREVYAQAASYKKIEIQELKNTVENNFRRVFGV